MGWYRAKFALRTIDSSSAHATLALFRDVSIKRLTGENLRVVFAFPVAVHARPGGDGAVDCGYAGADTVPVQVRHVLSCSIVCSCLYACWPSLIFLLPHGREGVVVREN